MRNFRNNLIAVASTLNTITVQGRENLDRLLGCIQMLERMVADMDAAEEEEQDNSVEEGEE